MPTLAQATAAINSVCTTACCVVGGGPGGMMLALLLARRGVKVTLLESHPDFDRDFRGDTIHPSTLEVLDQIGLADRLLQLPHGRMTQMKLVSTSGTYTIASFQKLPTRFPYIAMMPQVRFLDFLAEEGRKLPTLHLVMGANVQRLVEDNGTVCGVRYRALDGGWHDVRAQLVVGADGRHSKLRHLAGFIPIGTAPPMDVIWFRLPRRPNDPHEYGSLVIGSGGFCVVLERESDWQIGYVIPKGGYQKIRTAGLDELCRRVARAVSWLGDRVASLHDWQQTMLLSVESSRLKRWYRPGLLFIGDAAHVMSPVGGVGINYAIQDAVAAANILARPLLTGTVRLQHLREIQLCREFPVSFCQRVQGFIQQQLIGRVLRASDRPFQLPLPLRLLPRIPLLRELPARFIAFGIRRVRVEV